MKERLVFLAFCMAITIGGLTGCTDKKSKQPVTGEDMSSKTIEQVLGERTAQWMAIDRVVGVAVGMLDGGPCIRVFVSSGPDQVREEIPERVEGYPVVVEETGAINALDQEQ